MAKKSVKKTVKKRMGRPPVKKGDPGSNEAQILGGLIVYFATGSYDAVVKELKVSKSTLQNWIHGYPKLCERAKRAALEYRLQRSAEAIDKIEYRILEILDSKERIPFNQLVIAWGIHRDKYDRQMGIADRRELTGKGGSPIAMTFTFGDANLKPLIPDTKNRIKGYDN